MIGSVSFIISSVLDNSLSYLRFLSNILIADGVCDIPAELMLTACKNIELEMVS